MTGPATGRHVGAKLADLMHQARVAAAERIIPAEVAHRAEYHKAFMEQVEQDIAPTMRAMFQDVLDDPDCPEQAKAFLGPLVQPEHQGQFFLTILALLGIGLAGPGAAAAGWVQRLQNFSYHAHGDLKLSPAEAALAVLKGVGSLEAMADEARFAGMTGDTFNGLVGITGDPPGPEQLMEALRRGYIDAGRFEHGIRQSRLRDEWIDVLTKLRFAPPSAGESIAAAVQGHLSPEESQRHFSEAGIDPQNWQWMFDTAGRPPGAQEMITLLRRKKVDQATVEQAIRESDIKNKYIAAIIELATVVPPQRTVVSGLRQGAVDDAQAREWLGQLGYPAPAVDMLIKEAHSTKGTGVRDISLAETVSLYNEGLIDRGRAHAMLVALRFDDPSAEDILNLADVQREHKIIAASVTRIRSAYLGHKIDKAFAQGALDALHMDAASRDQALALWDIERTTQRKLLTEAQIEAAAKKNLIDHPGFVTRLEALGYTADDAELLWATQIGT